MSNNNNQDSFRGDIYDLIELQQLLAGPHKIIFKGASPYQNVLLIETMNIRLYQNNELKWNSMDERIFHEALVHPSMLLSERHDRILIIGDESGLALREVLKYPSVNHVNLVALSPEILLAAKNTPEIIELNEGSFSDKRVQISDTNIDDVLMTEKQKFDVIIAILPEEESLFFTQEFFLQLSNQLTDSGLMVCTSSSPKDASLEYWSISKTLESVPLYNLNYHVHVPWFGDCGFHLAGKKPLRWSEEKKIDVPNRSLPNNLMPWFIFSEQVMSFKNKAIVIVNSLDSLSLRKLSSSSEASTTPAEQEADVDPEELKELHHLLSNPHRILYEGIEGDHVLVLETTDVRLYLDKQLQFSSLDEEFYHEALVHPALSISQKRDSILIVGGGDGLAIREVLKYPDVKHIDLVDLDPLMLDMASNISAVVSLNKSALHDKRVFIHQQDIQVFQRNQKDQYDVIIVDLPDPGDEVLSRLYTVEFFKELLNLLTEDGILVCQSHSPEYAPLVYWSIGLTLMETGMHVQSYHINVPSFGDWGFHLAAKKPLAVDDIKLTIPNTTTLPEDLSTLFVFSPMLQSVLMEAQINSLSDLKLHEIYRQEFSQ
ncbi:spermidine synthase [Schinkia azotoformans]|uniref:Polyamine aminopropyltransferase n=1 Tax=Schinkia azotoformans LMG 9581 TaxID=1131731 RepID=K6DEZ4_SCHAZ|nr:spermidine synthase [Schinkia azotoformans]EKN71102.1 spermidine synthase [Schinkia azotoformans LMG 9581]MEC1640368.1 spermidine synthase [Schinkia azotoformans]MEC1947430.1 spermidine synthase [Schinkia azotoformans]MED4354179.1 spermidine synthase [Schinkia azotoformans]